MACMRKSTSEVCSEIFDYRHLEVSDELDAAFSAYEAHRLLRPLASMPMKTSEPISDVSMT